VWQKNAFLEKKRGKKTWQKTLFSKKRGKKHAVDKNVINKHIL
jgi:hypothetical protein